MIQPLIESTPARVPLNNEQASALSELGRRLTSARADEYVPDDEAPTRIRCTPTSRGDWSVLVDNAIGIVSVDDVQFVIRPKVPLSHLLFLLELAGVLPKIDTNRTKVSEDDNLLTLVARWYIGAVENLFRDTLLHDYREHEDLVPVARGSIRPLETARLYYSGVLQFACRYDEYDVDTPLNRVLKAAAERIAAVPVFGLELRRKARLIARRFVGVGTLRHTDLRFFPDRVSHRYVDAFSFGLMLLRGQSCAVESGSHRGLGFLIPTPHAVQAGITKLLHHTLQGLCSVTVGTIPVGNGVSVNPDLQFPELGAVGDVKYKLFESQWRRADLYQAVAFAAASGSREAAIIGFRAPRVRMPPQVHFSEIRVTPLGWNADPGVDPGEAAARLMSDTREWLTARLPQRAPAVAL